MTQDIMNGAERMSKISKDKVKPNMSKLFILDRVDMVKGHYGIGRHMKEYAHLKTPTWEYWNKNQWCSACEIFYDLESAKEQKRKLAHL